MSEGNGPHWKQGGNGNSPCDISAPASGNAAQNTLDIFQYPPKGKIYRMRHHVKYRESFHALHEAAPDSLLSPHVGRNHEKSIKQLRKPLPPPGYRL